MWWPVVKWVALGAAVIFIIHLIRADGAQSVKNSIERQNNEAAQNADFTRLDFDGCVGDDKLWNFGAGKCERVTQRGRD